MSTPVIVNVGPYPATLKAPTIARCLEVNSLFQRYHETPALGVGYLLTVEMGALGLCWPEGLKWPATIPPRPFKMGSSLLEWGEAVLENLVAAGFDPIDVLHPAGDLAVVVCQSRIPRKAAVDAAVGNSEAPPAPDSGTSSGSVVAGAETSAGGSN